MHTMDATLERPARAGADADALFDTLYAELHRLARRELHRGGGFRGGPGATTVLHEAYLRIAGVEAAAFVDHAHFLAYAARVMRGLIIDDLRRRRSIKRGGLVELTALDTGWADTLPGPQALVRIADALDELARLDADLAAIVDLKFFCGFSFMDIAAMRGVSERTVQRHWEKARLYLHHALHEADRPDPEDHAAAQS